MSEQGDQEIEKMDMDTDEIEPGGIDATIHMDPSLRYQN